MEDFTIDFEEPSVNSVSYELHFAQADPTKEDLDALRELCLGTLSPFLEGYIWQREAFHFRTSAEEAPPWRPSRQAGSGSSRESALNSQQGLGIFREGSLPCLWGCVQFGDNLEDEWFITWLLQQLTQRIPGLAARLWDNDGEFLLIEAAYSLPRWLKPETSTNRVWIARGKLHIVPLPSAATPSIPSFPNLTQALQLVLSEHVPTLAGSKAQAAIQARLADFQQGRHKHMHRARVIIPARVAAVLAAEPQLIAPAVEAFHYRDVYDMKAAARMQHFPPQDMVNVVAILSRCLYAQLEQQQFEPPKGFALPLPESATYRAAQLGMKLMCGFEMLYARRKHHADGGAGKQVNGAHAPSAADTAASGAMANEVNAETLTKVSAQAMSEDQVADNPTWTVYTSSLERNGYFKGNIPGSQQHDELMQAALHSFMASEAYKRSSAALAAPILRMKAILRQPPLSEQLEKDMQGAEDDDSWMRDGSEALERELTARQTEMEASALGKPPKTDFNPEDLVERMKAFVEKESSFEGAELPEAAPREGVSFDSKRFWTELGAALGMQPGDSDAFLQDLASDSDDEGSSFFGGASEDAESGSDDVSAEDDTANVYRAQRAERAQFGQAFPRSNKPSDSAAVQPGLAGNRQPNGREPVSAGSAVTDAKAAAPGNGAAPGGIKRGFLTGSAGAPARPAKPQTASGSAAGATAAAASEPGTSGAGVPSAAGGIAAADAQRWETLTATDSDDDVAAGDDDVADFMAEYEDRMERELGQSKVGASFERAPARAVPAPAAAAADAKGKEKVAAVVEDMGDAPGFVGEKGAQPRAGEMREEEEEEEELRPVDIDLNLVQNLLASYSGQQGLPGPVSNLMGLMGLHLPDDEDSRGKSAFDSFMS